MREDNILDYAGELTEVEIKLKKSTRFYLFLVIGLLFLNAGMFLYLLIEDPSEDDLSRGLIVLTFSITYLVIGLVVGTVTALFPYKGLEYSRKYLRAALLTTFVMQIIIAVLLFLVWITGTHKQ
jgi:hypothetical protein